MKEELIVVMLLLIVYIPIFYQLYIVIKEHKNGVKTFLKNLFFLKYSIFILIPIILVFAVLSHTNYLNYEKPMRFDTYNQITFENFRGLEFFKKKLYGNERFAYVVTSIECDFNENTVSVQSFFYPSRSFVYKKHTNSTELLTHEKYHIKITELFTRKAKERISRLDKFDKGKIKHIIQEIKIEEQDFQRKYDYDTFHSYVFSEQKRYEQEVDSLLNLLVKYKIPKIEFNEKN